MIEDEIRAAFARHVHLAPPTGPLRSAIDRLARRRRRRRLAVASTGTVLAVLAAVALPVLGRDVAVGPPPIPGASPAVPAGPTNLLLLGLDDHGAGAGHRTDLVLLAHIPADRGRVFLIALPRDLVVEIPGRGTDRLNAAFMMGSARPGGRPDLTAGARLTARTVADLTGVAPTGTVVVTYQGLQAVTDAAGGVRMCLPQRTPSTHTGRVFPAGCQRLDGAAVRDLLRQRYGLREGAFDRDRNAQRFLAALADQVRESGTNPARLSALLRAAERGIVADRVALTDLLPLLPQLANAEVTGIGWSLDESWDTRATPSGVSLDPESSRSLFDALRRDDLTHWVRTHPDQVTDLG
ncbi:LCP family protein [Plantactinospora sp. GCM10030261]|uniref:LCP family protein n=1 Tax=Plantactinospora sp. GCM10030261 TaxID=3273420 RepID=UPI0036122A07